MCYSRDIIKGPKMVASQSIFKAVSLKIKAITYEPYLIQTVHYMLLVSYAKAIGPFLFANRLIYSRVCSL